MAAENMILTYFPLWGAQFDSDESGLIGGRIMAYIPYKDEWRQIQKSSVWKEQFGLNPYDLQGPEPPLCLVLGAPIEPDESHDAVIEQEADTWLSEGYAATLALRLLKAGWFLDPNLAECTFRYGMFNKRLVGPYRQAFVAGVPEIRDPRYPLAIDDCATHVAQSSPTTRLWDLVWTYYQIARNSSADIAVANFMSSYGFQMGDAQRAMALFIALDAMFGGLNAREIAQVRLRQPFARRIAAAVQAAAAPTAGQAVIESARWLEQDGRQLRNLIAHGRAQVLDSEQPQAVSRLQEIVRIALRQYLAFSATWARQRQELSLRFRLPFDAPVAAAYNGLLDLLAAGESSAGDFLF